MSQTLVSNLTLRIEQEKQMMQEHQEKIERFQRTTENLLSSSESSLKSLQTSAVSTTQTVTTIMTEAKQSLSLIESEQGFSPFNRETEPRNSQRFDPTGAAAQAAKSTVRSLEQHEPRDSRKQQRSRKPFLHPIWF